MTGRFTVSGTLESTGPVSASTGPRSTAQLTFQTSATGSSLTNSSASGVEILGADDVVLEGNTFDGGGVNPKNVVWDEPAGDTPDGWRIVGNTFRNFYRDDGSHSEALYIGYSTNGLIASNTFTNNGTTAHVFFTYCGAQSAQIDGCASYPGTSPRNICVRETRSTTRTKRSTTSTSARRFRSVPTSGSKGTHRARVPSSTETVDGRRGNVSVPPPVRRGRDLNPRRSFHHVRDFQSRSFGRSDTSPRRPA